MEDNLDYAAGRFRFLSTLLPTVLILALTPRIASPEPDGFAEWLAGVRVEAAGRGISEATLESALSGIRPIQRVIDLDRHQPEFQKPLRSYVDHRVSEKRIRRGRELLRRNADLLANIRRKYGIPPRYIVSLWGIESNYGEERGRFPVVGALVTLAYDDRRTDFYRSELLNALSIIEDHPVEAGTFRGSWSGAMGQLQFMPSTYLRFAVDGDGDGRRDIWDSLADTFASAANYLSSSGWEPGYTWGREVRLPDGFNQEHAGLEKAMSLREWRSLGVRGTGSGELPSIDLMASLILPEGTSGPAYLVYPNYRALLQWNHSHLFVLAVCRLADELVRK